MKVHHGTQSRQVTLRCEHLWWHGLHWDALSSQSGPECRSVTCLDGQAHRVTQCYRSVYRDTVLLDNLLYNFIVNLWYVRWTKTGSKILRKRFLLFRHAIKNFRTREKCWNIDFGRFGLLSSSGDSFYVMDIFISNLDNLSKLYFDISSFWHSRIIPFQISSIR